MTAAVCGTPARGGAGRFAHSVPLRRPGVRAAARRRRDGV